ncbi:MAG: ABC transporter permease [Planctomycetota bacterium]|nr:MAG: ABC transporter permease [Planctomycetota bacterium]
MKLWVVFKRELSSYFYSPIAYIFLILFLSLTGYYFSERLFASGEGEMRPFFQLLPLTFLFIVPALTMRIWAEEKRSGTFEMLLTLPIKDGDVVWGKFLASWCFVAIGLLFTLPWIVVVNSLIVKDASLFPNQVITTSLDMGPVIMGYIAALFLAGAYLAVGSFLSSLTKHQLLAFILTASLLGVFYIMSQDLFLEQMERSNPVLASLIYYLSFAPHFESIAKGVLDIKDFVYFSSIILFFLELNRIVIAFRD